MGELVLAVDIGGTKMAAGLVDADGRIVTQARCPTRPDDQRPLGSESEGLFEALVELIESLGWRSHGGDSHGGEVVACGVGCGGPMTRGGETVSPVNIAAWRGFDLRRRLAEATGLDVVVDNDAKALALGEGWRGAARGVGDFIGMVVSTGVGGGIVVDGRLVDGRQGNAGHISHLVVEPQGRACGCGGRGCLEAEASGTAIAAITGRPAAEASPEIVERTGRLVGRAVAEVATLLDIGLAVVAGSVALGFGEPFFAAAQHEIDRCTHLDYARATVICPGALGHDGPLVGAAAVAWRALGRPVLG